MAGLMQATAPDSGPPRLARRLKRLAGYVLVRAGSVIAVLIGWEMLARSGTFSAFLLPSFSLVIERILGQMASGDWFADVAVTVYRATAGFLIAAAIGVPLGILMGRRDGIRWFFDPIVSAGFPAPKIAFLPVFILWFDLFDKAKIAMIAFESIFPIIAASWAGAQSVDKHLLWSARSMGASDRDLLTDVVLPSALPQIITGLQIAFPMALIIALVCEFVMGGDGLGAEMVDALRFGNSPNVFAGIVSMGIVGLVVIKLLEVLRARLLVWHSEAEAAP